MKHPWLILSCSAVLSVPLAWLGSVTSISLAQSVPPPLVQPPEQAALPPQGVPAVLNAPNANDESILGQPFDSQTAGISFRPPKNCRLADTISDKYVAEWEDPKLDWTLKLGKMILNPRTPLVSTKNEKGEVVIQGVLDQTVSNLQVKLPGGKILRRDLTNTRDGGRVVAGHPELLRDNVGMIAIRYTNDGRRRLSQQAIIQTTDGLYYLLTLTSPGSNAREDDPTAPIDPGELLAVDTFNRMIDSVIMLDRKAVFEDQELRLFHTRTAMVNWTPEKLHRLIGEQWTRIIKDGKDIGYSYITEDLAGGIPKPLTRAELDAAIAANDKDAERKKIPPGEGILIGSRVRTITEGMRSNNTKGPIQTDTANWLFVTADKKHEDFSRVVVTDDHIAPKKGYVQEFGASNKRTGRMMVAPPRDPKADPNTPDAIVIPDENKPDNRVMAFKEDWELDVSQTSNIGMAQPLVRKLPPWYIPQAFAHLLPRLLPLNKPQGYVFAVYVSDVGQVVMRYVDVMPEQNVTFNGQVFRAVPIRDRLGLQGSVTTHYLNMDGVYLGSENQEQKLVTLPTDSTTLTQIWKNADLTRPHGIDHDAPAAAEAATPRETR
jgi:hypothetical protein